MKSKRFIALFIDVFIVTSFCQSIRFILKAIGLEAIVSTIALSCVLLLCKDCYNGMSIGKRITNIQVFDSKTMKVASPIQCVLRNCFLVFYMIEVLIVSFSSLGLRIGDYIARTKVLERNVILTKASLSKVISTVGMVTIIFLILYIMAYNNAYRLGVFGLFFVP